MNIQKFLGSSFLISSFIILSMSYGFGQVNIKIGYNLGILNPQINNQILADFDDLNNDLLEIPLGDLHVMHGIGFGFRYKIDSYALELSWDNYSQSKNGIGETSNGGFFQQELFYSMNQFSFGFENYFGVFGLGSAVVWNKVKIKDRIANSDSKKTLVSENQLNLKINASYNFRNKRMVGLSLKPFVQIPLSNISLDNLADELNVNAPDQEESFLIWGISFIFYNGKQ